MIITTTIINILSSTIAIFVVVVIAGSHESPLPLLPQLLEAFVETGDPNLGAGGGGRGPHIF